MGKCYSTDNEDFRYDDVGSVLDALECDGRLEVGAIYYEADSQPLTTPRVLDADRVLEQADEAGYDLIGEEGWDNPFDVGAEARAELQDALNAWAKKHVDVSRYFEIVSKVRPITVTEADLPANNQVQRAP